MFSRIKSKIGIFREDIGRVFVASGKLIKYVFISSPLPIIIVIGTTAVTSLTPFLSAWVASEIIDELVNAIDPTKFFSEKVLFNLVLATILISVGSTLASTVSNLAETKLWLKVGGNLTVDITTKFAYLDLEHYENPKLQDKLNKISENYSHKPQNFGVNLLTLFSSLIDAITATVILVSFFPLIILLILITSLPSVAVNMVYGRRSWSIWGDKGDNRRDFHWTSSYLTRDNYLNEERVFGSRGFLLDRLTNLLDSFRNKQIEVENKRSKVSMLFSIFRILGTVAAGVIVILMVVAQTITIGQFTFYRSTIERLGRSFESLLSRISRLYEDGLYVADIFEFFELENVVKPGSVVLNSSTPPTIRFENVWFKYPKSKNYVLKDFNLTINPKEHIAIVGENGAGKTTLIKILMRFYDIQKGNIWINDLNLKDLDPDSWYEMVGTLFQDFNFYHFDAKTNIGIGDVKRLEETDRIIEAAKYSDADAFIRKYEHKYEQMLSKSFKDGVDPSQGQKQKIALARAFFKNAPLLILDEPTSSIDPKAEYEIFQKLFDFYKEKSVIIISHRFSTVRTANRILVLEDGRIIEEGSHEDLMTIKYGKYKHAFELQRKGYE